VTEKGRKICARGQGDHRLEGGNRQNQQSDFPSDREFRTGGEKGRKDMPEETRIELTKTSQEDLSLGKGGDRWETHKQKLVTNRGGRKKGIRPGL